MPLTLIKRLIKGIKLTHQEMDDNLTAIEQAVNAKAEAEHTHEIGDIDSLTNYLDNKIDTNQKGVANGVATLGAEAKIPTDQIPTHSHSLNDIIDWSATNHTHPISQIEGLSDELESKLSTSKIGSANGVASLDVNSLIPESQLPSHQHTISQIVDLPATIDDLLTMNLNANRMHQFHFLSSNISITTTARSNISDWVFDMQANCIYKIEIIADYQTAASGTGGSIGFLLNSGNAQIKGFVEMSISHFPTATNVRATIYAIDNTSTTNGSNATSSGVAAVGTPHSIHAVLLVKPSTNSQFQVQWGTEVAGSAAQINIGSLMQVTKIF